MNENNPLRTFDGTLAGAERRREGSTPEDVLRAEYVTSEIERLTVLVEAAQEYINQLQIWLGAHEQEQRTPEYIGNQNTLEIYKAGLERLKERINETFASLQEDIPHA